MKHLTYFERTKEKNVYRLSPEEFVKGDWCSHVSLDNNMELIWRPSSGILTINRVKNIKTKKLNS